uniref:CCHC-type domain-containing protein n=1 Tax=Ditylenchus dipsaci TaxID=166011 RepID=A0A915CZA4_9BILA
MSNLLSHVTAITLTSHQAKQYESQIEALSTQLSLARQKNLTLLEKNQEIMEIMKVLQTGVETLQDQNSSLRAENRQLKKKLGDSNADTCAASDRATPVSIDLTVEKEASTSEKQDIERLTTSTLNIRPLVSNNSKSPPPTSYICNRCNQAGHWFKQCPLINVRRPSGILRSNLLETTKDDPKAMLNHNGHIFFIFTRFNPIITNQLTEKLQSCGTPIQRVVIMKYFYEDAMEFRFASLITSALIASTFPKSADLSNSFFMDL